MYVLYKQYHIFLKGVEFIAVAGNIHKTAKLDYLIKYINYLLINFYLLFKFQELTITY